MNTVLEIGQAWKQLPPQERLEIARWLLEGNLSQAESKGCGGVTRVITHPAMGMRDPVHDLRGLFEDLLNAAATVLRPGGRLVLANPVSMEKLPTPIKPLSRQVVDFGGFDCRVEKYLKLPR